MALKGIKVIELAGLAPVPMCGMILKDFGARVIRVDSKKVGMTTDFLSRGKESILLDLKRPDHSSAMHRLCSTADVLLDPFRPGVLERLSLSPHFLHESNPGLIVARLTGYGQPLTSESNDEALSAGHDINYLSKSGILSRLGRHPHPPTFPANLLADFGGGGLLCALGIVLALYQRTVTGRGQIVDCSMTEGAAYLSTFICTSMQMMPHLWSKPRGHNMLDGGVHFYRTYKTKDDQYMAVGAIEPQFYHQLVTNLGLSYEDAPQFPEEGQAPQVIKLFEDIFASKTRDEWSAFFSKKDACVTPVLSMSEAASDPFNVSRASYVKSMDSDVDFVSAPAPKLSDSPRFTTAPSSTKSIGEHTDAVLTELGYSPEEIANLKLPTPKL